MLLTNNTSFVHKLVPDEDKIGKVDFRVSFKDKSVLAVTPNEKWLVGSFPHCQYYTGG